MLGKIKTLYVLAVVAFNTHTAWLPPHDLSHLSRDIPMGFVIAFFLPGVGLNMLLGIARSTPLILGGSFAFWLLLKKIGKSLRARQSLVNAGAASAPPPGWEGWSRTRTIRSEWEEE